jgi:hypothetical protein
MPVKFWKYKGIPVIITSVDTVEKLQVEWLKNNGGEIKFGQKRV